MAVNVPNVFYHIVNIQIRPSAIWQRKIDEDHLIENFIGSYTSSQMRIFVS